jgi:hypothetical protein
MLLLSWPVVRSQPDLKIAVLDSVYGLQTEVRGYDGEESHHGELYNLYPSSDIIGVINPLKPKLI